MALQMVTWWLPECGYCRQAASPEYMAMLSEARNSDAPDAGGRAMHVTGWEEIDGADDDANVELTFKVYQNQKTGDRYIDLWNCSQRLGQVHIREEHCDVFTMTEYLRIRQQAEAVNAADEFLILKKALISFIRYGQGKSTVSEFGTTRDEMDNRAAARRAREEDQAAS